MFWERVDALLGDFRRRGLDWAYDYAAASISIIRRKGLALTGWLLRNEKS